MKNDDSLPLLSIVIPVFNRQDLLDKLLKDLLKSILDKNLSDDIELVIIDDCSSPAIQISEFPLEYKLERNIENCGAPISRKTGFDISRGQYIHFHDSDDSIDAQWLESLLDSLKGNVDIDVFLTARYDKSKVESVFRCQKYYHRHHGDMKKINKRLVYRNCMGPLGGVTFSRRVIEKIEFKAFASCQDWQMYIDVLKHARVLISRPDIKFIFNRVGDDRISHNPRKKILGHLQLAKITGKNSFFGRDIRLFYLYTCKQHIYNKGGSILEFYKKNKFRITVTFLVISLYWRLV